MSSSLPSARVASRAVTVPVAEAATTPRRASSACSEPCSRSASRTARELAADGGVLEGDRDAVGEPHPLDAHHLGTVGEGEGVALLRTRRVDAGRHEARRGLHAAAAHLLGERQEHAGAAVHRPRRHERPLAPFALDEAGDGELLQRLAHGHPADVEAGAQLGLGRQPIARYGRADQLAQVRLDGAIAGVVD